MPRSTDASGRGYAKTADATKKIGMAWLDINPEKVSETELQAVKPPVEADLPDFVRRHLKLTEMKFDHGTVVVWVPPDRLSYRMAGPLNEHLRDDFGVTYRYILSVVDMGVEGTAVEGVDPLVLDHAGRYSLPPGRGRRHPASIFGRRRLAVGSASTYIMLDVTSNYDDDRK